MIIKPNTRCPAQLSYVLKFYEERRGHYQFNLDKQIRHHPFRVARTQARTEGSHRQVRRFGSERSSGFDSCLALLRAVLICDSQRDTAS